MSEFLRKKALPITLCLSLLMPLVGCATAPSTPTVGDATRSTPVTPDSGQAQLSSEENMKRFVGPGGTLAFTLAADAGFSNAARETMEKFGVPFAPIKKAVYVGGTRTSGWFEIGGGGGDVAMWNTEYYKPMLVNPTTGTMLKVGWKMQAQEVLPRDVTALKTSLRLVGDEVSAQQVKLVEVEIAGNTVTAVQMPIFPNNLGQMLRSGAISEERAATLLQRAYIHDYTLAQTIGVVHNGSVGDTFLAADGEQVFTLGFSMSSSISVPEQARFSEHIARILDSSYSRAAKDAGLEWKTPDLPDLLTKGVQIITTPMAIGKKDIAFSRAMESLPPTKASPPEIWDAQTGAYRVSAAVSLPPGASPPSSEFWRAAGRAASAGARVVWPILKGATYLVAADLFLKAIDPADNLEEKIGIPYSEEARISNYQSELTAQKKIDELFGSIIASKERWADRFQTDQDNDLRPELWDPYLHEEQALLDYYIDSGLPFPKLTEIRQEYRANVVQDLIKNSLIGWKKLEIADRVLGILQFNEEVYISATSADRTRTSNNRLIVWTAVPEANNQKRVVTLVEMAQAKNGGAWTIVQQSNEPITVKIKGNDHVFRERTVRFVQDKDNLNLVIAAAEK